MILPRNRFLILNPLTKKVKKAAQLGIELPEEYYEQNAKKEQYGLYKLIEKAPDTKIVCEVGDVVVVDNTMVQKFKIEQKQYFFVIDNYVIGVYKGSL